MELEKILDCVCLSQSCLKDISNVHTTLTSQVDHVGKDNFDQVSVRGIAVAINHDRAKGMLLRIDDLFSEVYLP